MAVALVALFVALGGPATAARLIDGGSIRRDSITTQQIRNRTLRITDLSRAAVRQLQRTPSKSIDARKLVTGAVGSAAVADKSIGANDLADGGIGPAQLSAAAVTSSKLADGAVGSGAIADGSLQSRDLGDFYGAIAITVGSVAENFCVTATVNPTPVDPGANPMIGDDVIVVTPPVGWPDQLTVAGYPGAGNTLRIVVCNPTKTPLPVPLTNPVFRYLGIDQP